MVDKIFESERLVFKQFNELTEKQIEEVGNSWANPFNARYNSMKNPYQSVREMISWQEPTPWGNYYRVAFDKQTNELIGTCRFGKHYASESNQEWDFGFNVVLKHWFKGYGVEILSAIIKIAKLNNAKIIYGGADLENYGSYKAMVKNGFVYKGIDEDGDYRFILDLHSPDLSKEQIAKNWSEHIERTRRDFGEEKFNKLDFINKKIYEMVQKINAGENENQLVEKYFKELNDVEEFKFSWIKY